jgi:hypothetical protein
VKFNGKMNAHRKKLFWSKVNKTDTCWLWTGTVNKTNGYGYFGIGARKTMGAHRVSYFMAKGPLPSDMDVCHRCDVRTCVRPSHLFAGTRSENTLDCYHKGRLRLIKKGEYIGSKNPTAKLSELKVRAMRLLHETDQFSFDDLALVFGVSHRTAWLAVRGKTWKHVLWRKWRMSECASKIIWSSTNT